MNPGIDSLLAVLELLEENLGLVASPLVASKLQLRSDGASAALIKMARSLSHAQLLGEAPLPEALPCALDTSDWLAARAPAERRVLLHAALDVTGDLSVVLEAACVDAAVLVGGDLIALLRSGDGQPGLLDHRLRGSILRAHDKHDVVNANRALARAAKRAGYRAASYLYSSRVNAAMRRGDFAAEVLREASVQFRRGFTHNAYTLARGVAVSGSSLVVQAQRIMGHASFWNGNFGATHSAFEAVRQANQVGKAEEEILDTIDWLRRDQSPRPKLLDVALRLRPLAASERDEVLLGDVGQASELWAAKEFEAFDTLTTQIGISMYLRPHSETNAWGVHQGIKATPIVGALLRTIDVGVCVQAGQWEQAALMMESSVRMVPLEALPTGIVSGAMSLLAASGRPSWSRLAQYYGASDEPNMPPPGPPPGDGLIALVNAYPPAAKSALEMKATNANRWAGSTQPLPGPPQPVGLSRRQKDVYRLLLKGHTNSEIGMSLGITERTVEAHLVQVYRKLGVHSRSELISRDLGNLRTFP